MATVQMKRRPNTQLELAAATSQLHGWLPPQLNCNPLESITLVGLTYRVVDIPKAD
jgi:hypothetical protein